MPNLVKVHYEQTGKSKSINEFGMRDMQEKAYEQRDAQYLLLKAPPDIKKVIVAVPERSIGVSFGTTDLKPYGFYVDWLRK